MNQYYGTLTDEFIAHHGIQGQKWGVRRFQNPDGSLTDEGRRRLGYDDNRVFKDGWKNASILSGADFDGDYDDNRVFKDGWKKVINEIIKNIGDQSGADFDGDYDDNRVFKDGGKKVINEIIKNIGDQKLETAYYDKVVKEAKARWTDSAKSKEYKKDLNDTGGEEYARKLARASGLDQGDNWKMYRDALAGDERAQAIVEEWEWERKYERYLP